MTFIKLDHSNTCVESFLTIPRNHCINLIENIDMIWTSCNFVGVPTEDVLEYLSTSYIQLRKYVYILAALLSFP